MFDTGKKWHWSLSVWGHEEEGLQKDEILSVGRGWGVELEGTKNIC